MAGGLVLVSGITALLAWPDSAVLVESAPSGAAVTVDGRAVGQTPLRLASKPWPLHARAELALPGHRPWSGSLAAGSGESRRIELQLDPLPASLALTSSPAGAAVSIDGRNAGQTPLDGLALAPGRHQVRLWLSSHQPWEAELDLEPGGRLDRQVSLSPLSITIPPVPVVSNPPAPPVAAPPVERPEPSAPAPARPEAFPAIAPPYGGLRLAPLAIMVENAPDARPQSGLGAADIVYEAMAEGGISRFMAVYVGSDETTVGPVRSARHYFVNLAAELGASMVHVGASPLGYDVLRAAGLRNLDETYAHPGFWRSRARLAPHNTYTSLKSARDVLDQRASPSPGRWAGFTFKDPSRVYQGSAAPRVALDYQPWGYLVEYRYDPVEGRYARFMEGARHLDADTQTQIRAAGVAVLRVSAWVIDAEGRLDMDQVSHGPAAYFVDGVVLEGTWQKPSASDPTRFLDADGNPVRFNPGPLWVQLVPYEGKVEY